MISTWLESGCRLGPTGLGARELFHPLIESYLFSGSACKSAQAAKPLAFYLGLSLVFIPGNEKNENTGSESGVPIVAKW